MTITLDLLRIVENAHSLERILGEASLAIAEQLGADVCRVFLFTDHGELVRCGAPGSSGDEALDADARSLAVRVTAERRVVTVRAAASLLAAPMLLRDRVIGALVLQSTPKRSYSSEEMETLAVTCGQIVGIVENARVIEALDRGESPRPSRVSRIPAAGSRRGEVTLHGLGASPGVAVGPAVFRGAYRLDLSARELPAGEVPEELERLRSAIRKTHDDIEHVQAAAAREIDEEHALIFTSHLLLLNDSSLLDGIEQRIAGGTSAPLAIDAALQQMETQLRLVEDPYLREKIEDIDDLRTRLLDHVLDSSSRAHLRAGIVLSSRIPPSLLIEMKTEGARGLVTETGGATSHGVLLARALGIPMVTGITDMLPAVRPGDQIVVDGTAGVVVAHPSAGTLRRYEKECRRLERETTEHSKYRRALATTADGTRVLLRANVGVASDLAVALENGAEGVGLYRTEFPFIVRDAFPTRAEQAKIYGKAYDVFPGGPIDFRLLDLGGDKFVTGGPVAAPRSAFHGYRSLRVLFDHPAVLRDQVQALALAARQRPLRILIPMITSLEDLRRAKDLIGEALNDLDDPSAQRSPRIGVMIEVPAAVEMAGELAREADFLSIGTNDLMQYTLVVDREDSRMAPLNDPYHPAILRMVARVVVAANAAGKPVGVCGEMAARLDLALVLTALGVDSLSVAPTAIPALKQALAGAELRPMRRKMESILALSDAKSVAAAVRECSSSVVSVSPDR